MLLREESLFYYFAVEQGTSVAGWRKSSVKQVWLADGLPGLCLAGDSLRPGDCLVKENPLLSVMSGNITEGR